MQQQQQQQQGRQQAEEQGRPMPTPDFVWQELYNQRLPDWAHEPTAAAVLTVKPVLPTVALAREVCRRFMLVGLVKAAFHRNYRAVHQEYEGLADLPTV